MKATLSLAALGLASLALCNCQQQNETPASVETATAPIVVTPVKVSFAPEDVNGKDFEIKKTGSDEIVIATCFGQDNTTPPITRSGAKYTKTGSNTAKIDTWDRRGNSNVYKLKFTSPTGGNVVGKKMYFKFS